MTWTRRIGLVVVPILMSLTAGCGGAPGVSESQVPVTVLAKGVGGNVVAVLASTSLVQLHALLYVASGARTDCAQATPGSLCWPDVNPPASSLIVALPTWGGGGPAPSLAATLRNTRLTLQQTLPGSSAGSSLAPAVLELAAIPLKALPKAVISVVAPPWDGPVRFGGAAIVDLRDPLPRDVDLSATIVSLFAAIDTASKDAGARLNLTGPQYAGIDRVGVMRWDDDSLGCPGITASSHTPVSGYILFLTRIGASSRELEYHTAAGRTVFCRYSP